MSASASSSTSAAMNAATAIGEPIVPRRLELSVDPTDGSLRASPLTQVLLSATDALYNDLYNMAHGELDVITTGAASTSTSTGNEGGDNVVEVVVQKSDRMANLSFAQRRHELQWRLHQHGQCLQHVAALTAAHASSDLSKIVQISSRALQHARTAWMQADEAQDALYFFHAQLFPSRASPHDVHGAADTILRGQWYDLPTDLRLDTDRYKTSAEASWSKAEVDARWQMSVRDKLVRGEVGWLRRIQNYKNNNKILLHQQQQQQQSSSASSSLWKLSLSGGILKLTHGVPKGDSFPIMALLTVLSSTTSSPSQDTSSSTAATTTTNEDDDPLLLSTASSPIRRRLGRRRLLSPQPWTLLSIEVKVKAKTGEFNHQLETSLRQRYDLHRLASLAMAREESRAVAEAREEGKRLQQQEEGDEPDGKTTTTTAGSEEKTKEKDGDGDESLTLSSTPPPPRPLHALFQVAHTFLLSWQLELLSAQAQALRRGVWAMGGGVIGGVGAGGMMTSASATTTTSSSIGGSSAASIHVTPVQFFDNDPDLLGVVSVSFWKVDDSYGPPSMGDLFQLNDECETHHGADAVSASEPVKMPHYTKQTNQLTISIRAKVNVGIMASLSGFREGVDGEAADRGAIQEILDATCNPLALSLSDALLAATRLCADKKCRAVAHALQDRSRALPPWILLSVERGCIAVAVLVQYHNMVVNHHQAVGGLPVLFRLLCDARTGSFVVCFPRQCQLLRELACNSVEASEPLTLRIASLPKNRRRAASASSSGRVVRDAFEGLIRSMNVLGQRTGVGGSWDDLDDKSPLLRERAIQSACSDVKVSLVKSCGMAALFGLTSVALGGAHGLSAVSDMAGEALSSLDGIQFLSTPPVSVLLDQQLVEATSTTSDGVNKKYSYLSQTLFCTVCSVSDESLTLYPLDVTIKLDSPTSAPQRTFCKLASFKAPAVEEKMINGDSDEEPSPKRQRHEMNGDAASRWAEDIMVEAGRFAEMLVCTIDPEATS